jgi:hypothetical protein
LLEEPFLGEPPFRAGVLASISSVHCFFHDVLLGVGVGLFAGDYRLSCRLLRDALDREADVFAGTRIATVTRRAMSV